MQMMHVTIMTKCLNESVQFYEEQGFRPGPMISPNPHARFFFVKDPNGVDIQFIHED